LDSLTHTVLGACVGEAIAGKKLGKQAMLWGALANNIPDIDVISSYWLNQADSLLAHRGFTHSIIFAIIFPPVLAFLFSRWHRNKFMHFRDWLWIFASGMFIHIFIDALTSYGTGWYEPFSHQRVTMNVLFVADPFYTISLLISFVALLIIRKGKKSRRFWTRFGLGVSTLYVVYAFVNKAIIDSDFRKELHRQDISYSKYFTTPAPLNNFLWYLVAKNDTGYYIGYHSFFDSRNEVDLHFRPRNENLLAKMPQDKDLITLKRFSKDYYAAEQVDDTLYLSDLRFGTAGGWEDPNADFVFRYCLEKNANNDLIIQRGRFKSVGKETFVSLWRGICGN
jgi:inner membrane protein